MTVSPATIRQDVYSAVRTLLVANKPTYTYDSATQTYSIVAEYGRQASSFPYIVINPASVQVILLDLDGSGEDYAIEVQLDFYALESHRKKAIDAGQDSARNTFIGNISTFISTDKLSPQEDFWTDTPSPPFQDNGQIINTGSSIVRFKLA